MEQYKTGRKDGAGPWVHNTGRKAERDRAVILASYREMCKAFRVPKSRRLSEKDIARMPNAQLYQASKDLYNGATIKQARRLAVRMGVAEKAPGIVSRAVSWVQSKVRGFRVEGGKRA